VPADFAWTRRGPPVVGLRDARDGTRPRELRASGSEHPAQPRHGRAGTWQRVGGTAKLLDTAPLQNGAPFTAATASWMQRPPRRAHPHLPAGGRGDGHWVAGGGVGRRGAGCAMRTIRFCPDVP